jgi:hypothetical protein
MKHLIESTMFHATFVVKHTKIVVATSIFNIETSWKTSTMQHHKMHWFASTVCIYSASNIQKSQLQHHDVPLATWQLGSEIAWESWVGAPLSGCSTNARILPLRTGQQWTREGIATARRDLEGAVIGGVLSSVGRRQWPRTRCPLTGPRMCHRRSVVECEQQP